jgi:subtilisin family serine protease
MAKRASGSPAPDPEPPSRKTGSKFDPKILDRTTIALPLLDAIRAEAAAGTSKLHDVVIDLNLDFGGGRVEAKSVVLELIAREIGRAPKSGERVHQRKTDLTPQYVFASLRGETILAIVHADIAAAKKDDAKAASKTARGGSMPPAALSTTDSRAARGMSHKRAIYRVWPDFEVQAFTNKSIATVKADAAQRSFDARGADIVWAVIDSGIDATHPHFRSHETLEKLPPPLDHLDFSSTGERAGDAAKTALRDGLGHGTHVAGIIAGEGDPKHLRAVMRRRADGGGTVFDPVPIGKISGMAPMCKLLSLRVLDDEGRGNVSNIIAALAQIQEWNAHGRRILVHGINLSVGYGFDAEWFACGQSPLCVEVDRLVKSGVVVVVAAGNTGYGTITSDERDMKAGIGLTINDPGNSELAITVGSTHRDMPHIYGVSYFSSKGPTGDGRAKPDLVAPGEKILSCATGNERAQAEASLTQPKMKEVDYVELSGTSMAAPHVSGVIAAFLSVRREFIGQPDVVKSIFLSNATDLKREPSFQGHGLVDLMRAIQSV